MLGDWLTAQHLKRPVTTWALRVHDHKIASYPATAIQRLRQTYDLVILDDGHIEEGRPGAHNHDRFTVPTTTQDRGLGHDELADMYAQGARTLLVTNGHTWSATAASASPIDRIIIGLSDTSFQSQISAHDLVISVLTSHPETQLTFAILDLDET